MEKKSTSKWQIRNMIPRFTRYDDSYINRLKTSARGRKLSSNASNDTNHPFFIRKFKSKENKLAVNKSTSCIKGLSKAMKANVPNISMVKYKSNCTEINHNSVVPQININRDTFIDQQNTKTINNTEGNINTINTVSFIFMVES